MNHTYNAWSCDCDLQGPFSYRLCPSFRSHEQTTARLRLVASKLIYDVALASNEPVDSQNIYGHTKILFDDAKEQMAQGSFQPVLDPASINCRETLSWWKPTVGGSL